MSRSTTQFSVTVIMERRPIEGNRWVSDSWAATAVVVGDHGGAEWREARQPDPDGRAEFLVGGLRLRLHVDECESYYHNLLADAPRLFVVTREEVTGARPQPFQVTASFDEAHAYLEAEETVHAVPIPPEVYRAVEEFVLNNYAPEPRKKRKRERWHEGPRR